MTPPTAAHAETVPGLTSDEALRIARLDAEQAYRDLSRYSVRVALEEDGRHVDHELKDQRARGGGPHYVLEARTGQILSKRYEQ